MLRLRIVSPEKVMFHGEVESVLVPGMVGPFEIIEGGFVEVKRNEVNLCVEV